MHSLLSAQCRPDLLVTVEDILNKILDEITSKAAAMSMSSMECFMHRIHLYYVVSKYASSHWKSRHSSLAISGIPVDYERFKKARS